MSSSKPLPSASQAQPAVPLPPITQTPARAPAAAKAAAPPPAPALTDGLDKTPKHVTADPPRARKVASGLATPAKVGVATGRHTPSPTAAAAAHASGPADPAVLQKLPDLVLADGTKIPGVMLRGEKVYMLRPGIALQANYAAGGLSEAGFVGFLDKQLKQIEKTQVGKDLLAALAKEGTRLDDKGQYAGASVLFTELDHSGEGLHKSFEPPHADAIVGSSKVARPKRRDDNDLVTTAIPRIQIPRLAAGQAMVYAKAMEGVGKLEQGDPEKQEGEIVLGPTSVAKHPDFPEGTGYDTVVFHELVHAHLQQTGVSAQLQKTLPAATFLRTEEDLVVGLKDEKGKVDAQGLYFSENTYRLQSGQEPRASYVPRDIHGEANPAAWEAPAAGKDQYRAALAAAVAPLGVKLGE